MGYVEENLLPGEEIVYRAKLHWIILVLPAILMAFGLLYLLIASVSAGMPVESRGGFRGCSLSLIFVALLVGLTRSITYRTSEFAVTSKRVLIKVGWIRRHSLELLLQKIEGIGVDQGIFGRWLGYGTITVTGTGGTKEPFKNIAEPLEFRKQVQARIPA